LHKKTFRPSTFVKIQNLMSTCVRFHHGHSH
jgi:hypothetical protein